MNKGRNLVNLQALKTQYNSNFSQQLLRRVQDRKKDHMHLKTISPPNLAQSQAQNSKNRELKRKITQYQSNQRHTLNPDKNAVVEESNMY